MTKKEPPAVEFKRFPPVRKSLKFSEGLGNNKDKNIARLSPREFIDDRTTEQKDTEALLNEYCAKAGINPILREQFKAAIRVLADEAKLGRVELLEMIVAQREGAWAKRIESERTDRRPLPETAPALWAQDKQPGDTPPSFIKRHYGEHLRSDATGLTRPDIKRLDPQLYMALRNWLRKNELPSDCPLPTKAEESAALLQNLDRLTDPRHVKRAAAALTAKAYTKS